MLDTVKVSQNLRLLRQQAGLSFDRLAKELQAKYDIAITPQTLKNYERAARYSEKYEPEKGRNLSAMRIEYLVALADFYGVSTDWILGLSDVRLPNADARAACSYTGLADDVVDKLHAIKDSPNNPVYLPALNDMLQSDGMDVLLLNVTAVKNHCQMIQDEGVEDALSEYKILNGELFGATDALQDLLKMLYRVDGIRQALLTIATNESSFDDDHEGSEE